MTNDPIRCPECGSPFQIEEHVVVEEPVLPGYIRPGRPLPRRTRIAAAVAFCTGCEYTIEITAEDRRLAD